ncbi:N-6 DNA methylase, partial [Nonomuraea sp. RK-328]|nr:N-6 DNA methylase [Nonomuraea sp. RK-328]
MDSPEEHLARSEIARLAGVRRPAVSNWERRHADYPRPVRIEAEELFPVAAVAEWLDGRVIPRNALMGSEQPGTTYGARFRANLVEPEDRTEPERQTGPGAADADLRIGGSHTEEAMWRLLDRFRGTIDLTRHLVAVLALIYARARDQAGWAAAESEAKRLDWAVRALDRLSAEDGVVTEPRPDREVLRAAAAFADQAARDIGGAEASRMLLDRFVVTQGKKGEEFYTPGSVVRALVDAVHPGYPAEIYDPSCRAGEVLLAASSDLLAKGAKKEELSLHGATLSVESSMLARMNLLLHGVDVQLGTHERHVLCQEASPPKHYRYIMTNPPFSMGNWCDDDPASCKTWRYGPPPRHNANFAWLQYVLERLAPDGRAAVLMPYNATFSVNQREQVIRRGLVEEGRVKAVVALPDKLFRATAIGVTLWVLSHEEPRREILFVDASAMGQMMDRVQRELSQEDRDELEGVLTAWHDGVLRSGPAARAVAVPVEEVGAQGFNLNPRKYVAPIPVDPTGSREAVRMLRRRLERLQAEALDADAKVEGELRRLGW